MLSISDILLLMHLFGLALGVGSATVKLVLLFKCRSNPEFVSTFKKVSKPITKILIIGLVLLTISGISWLIRGYSLYPFLTLKVILVAVVWILGPVIDNVVEPKYFKLAPSTGEKPSVEFIKVQNQYLTLEITADVLFYGITIMGAML